MAEEKTTQWKEYAPVLAKYDVRAKQKFIYSSTHLKEIVGASWLIRDCFYDFLRPAAQCVKVDLQTGKVEIEKLKNGKYKEISNGIFGFVNPEEKSSAREKIEPFTEKGVVKHIREGYIGEIVYEGGGNFLVVYYNEKVYKEVNKIFYREVLEKTGTMRVLSSCVEVNNESDKYFINS